MSLGKEASTGQNHAAERGDKPGYQYQWESVFSARQIGWDAEHVGGHVVRNNTIHDCGQNAVVGHLGCAFSTIEDNHIFNIATKREFYGYEIAGIKLHAAVDAVLRGNVIHDCSLGIWLDWQAQGTRVTRNVLFGNCRDLFVEVSHGPYLVDNNVLGSPVSLEIFSQGGAYVHNLVCGLTRLEPVPDRATPYHRPHSTQVAGYSTIQRGDDRDVGNLFVPSGTPGYAGEPPAPARTGHGTAGYDGHPPTPEEYRRRLNAEPPGDISRFLAVDQAVHVRDNAYASGAAPYAEETRPALLGDAVARVGVQGGQVVLEIDLPEAFGELSVACSGLDLPRTRLSSAEFEERDGSPADLGADLLGTPVAAAATRPPGPLAGLRAGGNRVRVASVSGRRSAE